MSTEQLKIEVAAKAINEFNGQLTRLCSGLMTIVEVIHRIQAQSATLEQFILTELQDRPASAATPEVVVATPVLVEPPQAPLNLTEVVPTSAETPAPMQTELQKALNAALDNVKSTLDQARQVAKPTEAVPTHPTPVPAQPTPVRSAPATPDRHPIDRIFNADGLLFKILSPTVLTNGVGKVEPFKEGFQHFEQNLLTAPAKTVLDWPSGFYTNENGGYQFLFQTTAGALIVPSLPELSSTELIQRDTQVRSNITRQSIERMEQVAAAMEAFVQQRG